MNFPTRVTDVWTPATDGEKLKALAAFANLPSRESSSVERDEGTFFIALDGVSRFALFEAVKAVLQNKLGHPFFPSPPELRGLCDEAMKPHERMRERIQRNAQAYRERPPEHVPLTPAERERQAERMQHFYRSIGAGPEAAEGQFLAEMEAKYGADALASVPDNPKRLDVPGFSRPKA